MKRNIFRRKPFGIIALFALLLAAAAFLLVQDSREARASVLFSVEIASPGGTETLDCWQDDDDNLYVFLPGYTVLSQACVRLNTGEELFVDGVPLSEGMTLESFELEVPHVLSYTRWGSAYETQLTFVMSGGVSTVYIDTNSGSMEYIHNEKGNEETGSIRIYSTDGEIGYAGGLASVKGRGNNTWNAFDKKPYSIILNEEADLFGMGGAYEWILLANASDPSNLRNKLVFEFAGAAGIAYTPESVFVDLYLNGEYAGLYMLTERIEVRSGRMETDAGDTLLVSMEARDRLEAQDRLFIETASGQTLRVHQMPAGADIDELTAIWQSIENAVMANDGIDPVTGRNWYELTDSDSWAAKYLIEEVFYNGDGCYMSQFFYIEAYGDGGVCYAGPVWDYDHTMGYHLAWQYSSPEGLYANRLYVRDGVTAPWFSSLYEKEGFYDIVTDMYEAEFLPLLDKLFANEIYEYAAEIRQASAMNAVRWGITIDIDAEVDYIADYMTLRIAFLDSVWLEGVEYHNVRLDAGFGEAYAYRAVEDGNCMDDVPVLENSDTLSFAGWYHADTGERFDPSQPITSDIALIARWNDEASRAMGQLTKLVPLGIFMAVLGILMLIEFRRSILRRG